MTQPEICMYCGAELPPQADTPPAVDDHRSWRLLSEQHAEDCEWIATRAHRRDLPAEDELAVL